MTEKPGSDTLKQTENYRGINLAERNSLRTNRRKGVSMEQQQYRKIPYVTIFLTAVNILVFLGASHRPEWWISQLADGGSYFLAGQYYRLVTSMFLHVEIAHLFNNMLLLYFAGEMVENKIGHWKYLTVCLGAGLVGNLASDFLAVRSGSASMSFGASGVVFGIFGAMLWLVILHRGKWQQVTLPRILFMLIYAVYSGFASAHVDNAAHIGGLAGGFVLALLLCRPAGSLKKNGAAN